MKKIHVLIGSTVSVIAAGILGACALPGAAFSLGLTSIGLFFISTQIKE